jgi:hypothetical protein
MPPVSQSLQEQNTGDVMVTLGSNNFEGVPFPLVLADRFFHIYPVTDGSQYGLDVFRWDEASTTAVYEVKGSKPVAENIDTNPTAIVTFGAADGSFLFKFRPKPGVSQIFGKVPVSDMIDVRINDKSLRVCRGEVVLAELTTNTFSGCSIGVMVGADCSISMGVNWLPAGMVLQPSQAA